MVTADFNHDGKADLATLNTNDHTITLLFGDGTGNFIPAPSSPISAFGMTAMATGDFNGDRIPDLALTGPFGTEVLLGDGTGMLTKAGGLTGAYSNFGGEILSIADFNGDGKLDLAFGDNTQGFVFLGDGTGLFTFASEILTDHQMYDLVAGDFNGDGYSDLAAIGYFDFIQVTFGPFRTAGGNLPAYNAANVSFSFSLPAATGAFQGGTNSDLLTFAGLSGPDSYPQVWYWTGNTTNVPTTFNRLPTSTVPAQPSFAVVADFNGDGNLDWAATNPSLGTVTVAFGLGNGSFVQAPGSPFQLGGSPFTLAAADFNGDGKPDLAVDTGSSGHSAELGRFAVPDSPIRPA